MTNSSKALLRKLMLEKRTMLSAEVRLRAAEAAAHNALPLFESERGTVAIYWPVRNEISPLILAEHLHARKFELCLPVVIEKDSAVQFRKYAPGDKLHKGRFGVDEPSQKSPYLNPSVLIVPLVAFDKKGRRLGTGGGYYDRTLAALRAGDMPVKAYGYAFAVQEVSALPYEPHDQLLDAVITEERIVSRE
jgi:5-formyltetrahydrofolate cyclo-ligase